ncbi:tRNA (adenosine(37)-N6)-threonylcarbamoyltransferase complex ATPase subunit type 1 TsaE [Flavobacteriaceae bacterium]|nr:tRNA (adenosine(37)-N6)-threonylcarbamoyltransferase complex ATPase subunit type 1 TsaE [Flavobacteriaceae bacterium]MDA9139371.1 tRNA (adenosine(37)-N6)-threonylcarbamoyltransferase complex ATPase subunit type 1 TsaE [Flavobacteriaceae bacterium]|tara:strand:- start:145 stop:558 length:414 start_codon:yes stop_codon:yes gene_type:complete
MKIEFSLKEINKAVVLLNEKLIHPIVCFNGDLGAGKTTFIRQLCLEWGVVDNISSPTFSIINQYKSTLKGSVFHFDFYRMEDAKEAMDIGVEEYLDSGQICLIEWGEKIESLLPQENIHIVEISLAADNKRVLELKK